MIKILLILSFVFSLYAQEKLKTFNVAYMTDSMSNYSKKDLKIAMNIWLKEISKKAGYDANMFFYDDPKEAEKDLEAGKIDYVSGFPLVFVKYFDLSLLSNAFSGGPKKMENNIFVVLSHKGINRWEDIQNLKIGIQKNDEIMYIYTKLKLHKVTVDIKAYNKRSKLVLDLFFNKLDIAIVPLRNFLLAKDLNPQVGNKIKILETTNINATNLSFYRKNLDENIKKEVFEEAKKIYSTKKGHQMMLIYKADKLMRTKLSDLEPIKKLYDEYLQFLKEEKK